MFFWTTSLTQYLDSSPYSSGDWGKTRGGGFYSQVNHVISLLYHSHSGYIQYNVAGTVERAKLLSQFM